MKPISSRAAPRTHQPSRSPGHVVTGHLVTSVTVRTTCTVASYMDSTLRKSMYGIQSSYPRTRSMTPCAMSGRRRLESHHLPHPQGAPTRSPLRRSTLRVSRVSFSRSQSFCLLRPALRFSLMSVLINHGVSLLFRALPWPGD